MKTQFAPDLLELSIEVQELLVKLGPRAMMWRNGTHIIDCLLWFADSKPKWVMGDFEDGYEDYTHYGQRGADGGKDPGVMDFEFKMMNFGFNMMNFDTDLEPAVLRHYNINANLF